MTNWIKTSERQPTEKNIYLIVYDILGHHVYDTCRWTPNLYDMDEYDFPEEEYEHSGFYDHDPEWGSYEVSNIEAWMEIEEYIP